jgi:hypothetical protein
MARHAVQPAGKASRGPDAGGLARQDKEGRLEGVFGVVPVPEHVLADAQDHRPVAGHQYLECRRIAAGKEAAKEPGVVRFWTGL